MVHQYFAPPPSEAAESVAPTASNQDRAIGLGVMTLCLVAALACLFSAVGCSNGVTKKTGQTGNRAFGYNDFDAILPRLDISRLTVRNAAELLYLMIDAQDSNITFTEFGLAECPKLRSLNLHAPASRDQRAKCRMTAKGTFSWLVDCRLYNLVTDAESLARLSASESLRRHVIGGVELEDAVKEDAVKEDAKEDAKEERSEEPRKGEK